jgi:hypothetical protein
VEHKAAKDNKLQYTENVFVMSANNKLPRRNEINFFFMLVENGNKSLLKTTNATICKFLRLKITEKQHDLKTFFFFLIILE